MILYGWLSPEGEFYKCDFEQHYKLGKELIKKLYNKNKNVVHDFLFSKNWSRIHCDNFGNFVTPFDFDKSKDSIIEFVSKYLKNDNNDLFIRNEKNGKIIFDGNIKDFLNSGLFENMIKLKEYIGPQTGKGVYGWLGPDGELIEVEFEKHAEAAYKIVKKYYKKEYDEKVKQQTEPVDKYLFLFDKGWTRISYDTLEFGNKKALNSIIEIVSKYYKNIIIDIWFNHREGPNNELNTDVFFKGKGLEFLEKDIKENKLSLKNIIKELKLNGLSKGKKESNFDPIQIKKGIKVEKEHTRDPKLAKKIAMDHLVEDPKYYDKLEKAGL